MRLVLAAVPSLECAAARSKEWGAACPASPSRPYPPLLTARLLAAASAERAARRGAEAAAEEKAAVGRALSAALQETERYKAHVDVAAAAAREESAARCVAERQVEELQAVVAKQEAQLGAAGCVSFFTTTLDLYLAPCTSSFLQCGVRSLRT
eukprot:COSAG04_NODE_3325_length_2932_cov_1.524179_3_plen_153_part_00